MLRRAQIVFYDALVHADTVALADKADKIAVGKRCGKHSTAQRFINKRLIDAAARFDTVVRLKGGDPMLFGRAQEEIDALQQAGVTVEIVPGVTSALAASAELKISLTRRGMSRTVVFATPRVGAGEQSVDWAKSVAAADTAVIYMAAGQAEEVAARLLALGMAANVPVAIVENASLPNTRRLKTCLGQLGVSASAWGLTGPATIMLGEVYHREAAASQPALNEGGWNSAIGSGSA